jgi:hypothetical protein
LVKFIPGIFEPIVSRIIFLASFVMSSLLVYSKATNFCVLILYLATLLKVLINSPPLSS